MEELINYFNSLTKEAWTEEIRSVFHTNYDKFAENIAKPVLEKINNSDARKKIKTVIGLPTLEIGNSDDWNEYTTESYISWKEPIRKFSLNGCVYCSLEAEVNEDVIDNMITRLSDIIISSESLYIDYVKSLGLLDKATLYIIKDFLIYPDPCVIKCSKIGVFGWEEIAVVIERSKNNA